MRHAQLLAARGLQFSGMVVLTASFWLTLSASIYFLDRLRLEERPGDGPGTAVERVTLSAPP